MMVVKLTEPAGNIAWIYEWYKGLP